MRAKDVAKMKRKDPNVVPVSGHRVSVSHTQMIVSQQGNISVACIYLSVYISLTHSARTNHQKVHMFDLNRVYIPIQTQTPTLLTVS